MLQNSYLMYCYYHVLFYMYSGVFALGLIRILIEEMYNELNITYKNLCGLYVPIGILWLIV